MHLQLISYAASKALSRFIFFSPHPVLWVVGCPSITCKVDFLCPIVSFWSCWRRIIVCFVWVYLWVLCSAPGRTLWSQCWISLFFDNPFSIELIILDILPLLRTSQFGNIYKMILWYFDWCCTESVDYIWRNYCFDSPKTSHLLE